MDSKNLKTRDQIDNKYKWNIETMIPDESIIDGALEDIEKQAGKYAKAYGGRLTSDAATLLSAFKERDSIWRELEKIYVYARMRRDEDNSDSRYQAMSSKCNAVIAAVSAALAFFTPELLSASEDDVMGFVDKEPGLEEYRFAIKDTFRQKAHILSQPEENIMAQMSEVTGATNDIFTMLNNADMKFPEITDEDGDKVAVTHGNYITFMESHDRGVRKAAYEAMY
ncbi:MAG: oligoendopeptidase F, partial [Anaerovoracaceae bacterium]